MDRKRLIKPFLPQPFRAHFDTDRDYYINQYSDHRAFRLVLMTYLWIFQLFFFELSFDGLLFISMAFASGLVVPIICILMLERIGKVPMPFLSIYMMGICFKVGNRLHREGKPAVYHADGARQYVFLGERHRMDGPAAYGPRSEPEYCVFGQQFPEQTYNLLIRDRSEMELACDFYLQSTEEKLDKYLLEFIRWKGTPEIAENIIIARALSA